MNAFGIFRIGHHKLLIPWLYSLWPNDQFVTKWLLVIVRIYLVSFCMTNARSTPLEFWKSDHVQPRYNLNLNPLILNPLVTKWSICDQMTVGLLQNRLVWLSRDPYEMNAFGIFRIGHHKLLIPGLYPLWPNDQFVTKWLLVIARTYVVSSRVTRTRWTPLEFWKSDHERPRN